MYSAHGPKYVSKRLPTCLPRYLPVVFLECIKLAILPGCVCYILRFCICGLLFLFQKGSIVALEGSGQGEIIPSLGRA